MSICLLQSFVFPSTNHFSFKVQHKIYVFQEDWSKKLELRKYVDCQVLKDTPPQSWTIKQSLQNKSKLHKLVVFLVY